MFDGLLGGSATDRDGDDSNPETTFAPDVPDTSDVDVPPDVARLFWSLVIAVNVGVLLVCLGAMFVYFRGRLQLGLSGVFLGLLTLGYAYLKYRVAEPLTDRDP